MSIKLNDVIDYGTAKFKVIKFATSKDLDELNENITKIVVSNTQPQESNAIWIKPITQEQQNQES